MQKITVLWCLSGLSKDIECVLFQDGPRLVVTVERGMEHERFWTFPTSTIRDVLVLSTSLRNRLVSKGWTLVHAEGEERLAAAAA